MKELLLIIILAGSFCACNKSGDSSDNSVNSSGVDCSGPTKSFANDVDPIIQTSCGLAGCHGTGSTNGCGPLLNYTQVFNARSGIRNAIASGFMPENGSLSASQKNKILCWIDNGAPNN